MGLCDQPAQVVRAHRRRRKPLALAIASRKGWAARSKKRVHPGTPEGVRVALTIHLAIVGYRSSIHTTSSA